MSRTTPSRPRTPSADSPCVKVCTLHPDGSHCVGCFRTVAEIGAWSGMSRHDRETVIARLGERRAARREELRALRRERRSAP